jgi:hypothetical protein
MKFIKLLIAMSVIAVSTSGCGALLLGYLIGDGIARDNRVKACRENLQTVNASRLAKGQEAFPDQCGS